MKIKQFHLVVFGILFLLLTAFASAQAPDIAWEYNGVGTFYSVVPAADGGFAALLNVSSSISIVKLNQDGELVFNKQLPSTSGHYGRYMSPTGDGGYIITGSYYYKLDPDMEDIIIELILIKADSNGDVVWEKHFSDSSQPYGVCVKETSDNGFIICGTTALILSEWTPPSDMVLLKTDSAGNKLWDNYFSGLDEDCLIQGKYVEETSDGGFILTGYEHSIYVLSPDLVYLIKTNSSGDLVWRENYDSSIDGVSVRETNDNGYMLLSTGYSYVPEVGDYSYLTKVNSTGVEQWQEEINSEDSEISATPYFTARSCVWEDDGSCVIAGNNYNGKTEIIKTNSVGVVQGSMLYETATVYSICASNDGGYVFCGSGFIAKFDGAAVPVELLNFSCE